MKFNFFIDCLNDVITNTAIFFTGKLCIKYYDSLHNYVILNPFPPSMPMHMIWHRIAKILILIQEGIFK